MPELRFDGRVAIVTGAGRGLGRAHAVELARRGAKVVANESGGSSPDPGTADTAAESVESTAERVRAKGGTVTVSTDDITTEDGAQALVETALDTYGRVDIVVNSAGMLRDRAFVNLGTADWDTVVGVHLRGTFLVTRAAFGHMRGNGYGRIVNTTSPSGLFGNFGQSNYAAAKMGVIGLTKTLAIEGAKYDITANAIAPVAYSPEAKGLYPAGAETLLSPERVTPAVVWLVHEDCETTGEVYSVGGGRVARVFVAEGPGAALGEGSAEDLRDLWPDVNAERPYVVPRDLGEQTRAYLAEIIGRPV
ncbi:SDR family NAD(P)-dependent oxidoreductase [Streptomonospora nanhaiensis]|uniref:NAD(P)-dependent dehydrogenase (Short-subunit alcohol dehydrogenase family) n=1 Tax=Streptomonospora nanhaiensis TaxID=1323731 RepID=A0A853BRF7_9ACTN|nr:SDR family NAD(P)-dependent oxidoreductase [Streptomonospora nanhaiensis]MBV2362673.1 SDR family NAD(P)-dependent oxidoreductase [Streptomonospora nanhaiensis]MBX9387308.1 SDR family NAD(P)-dependent oxidoreductase [Streptomonospora nanhaiensis]NYI97978.1 NAD(P)-dependent dehydrogenase (short-subunit alcohol dehydrogenase family) [Streptomonospora nanhaiensis]